MHASIIALDDWTRVEYSGETIAVSEATTGGFTNALLQAVPNASRFSVGAITV
jgi:nicotinamide mononucleotide (NMN) deamidase PncC